jgi:hypothetical protein
LEGQEKRTAICCGVWPTFYDEQSETFRSACRIDLLTWRDLYPILGVDIYRHKFIDEFKGSEVQGEAGVWLLVSGLW